MSVMGKTIVWDYNGTIIDDIDLCLSVENMMMEKRGMHNILTLEKYQELFCFPVINYYKKLGYTFENETYDEVSVEFHEMYDRGFPLVRLMEGFEELITKAVSRGYNNVILSAAPHEKLLQQCEDLGISRYFSEILGTDNLLGGSKIEMAKRWMGRSAVRPEDCLYIGDTVHDAETAAAIGIKNVVLLASGHQAPHILREYCRHVIMSLSEIDL